MKYEILTAKDSWVACKKAAVLNKGWLHFELRDGTVGMAQPGKWREKQPNNASGSNS